MNRSASGHVRRALAARWPRRSALLGAVVGLPAVALVPYLWTPLPRAFHTHREIAGYFQALAYWRDPIGQFTYLTPAENLSALHFHGLLSAPLVGLGYSGGGRLVALAMGVASAAILATLAGRLFDDRAALVAPGLLWCHPLFSYLAGSFMPETTSVALTAGSVLALLAFYRGGRTRRYDLVAAGLLVLAVATHMWEGVVVFPLTVLALHHGDVRRALLYPATGVATVLVVWAIGRLQPFDGSSLARYAVWTDPGVLLSADRFWFAFMPDYDPLAVAVTITLPLAVVACLGATAWYARERTLPAALLASWLAAGLAIPFLLANGYHFHQYYLWGLLAPLSLVGALVVARGLDVVWSLRVVRGPDPAASRRWLPTTAAATRALAVVLVVLSVSSTGVFQLGLAHGSGLEVVGDERGEIAYAPNEVSHERVVELGRTVRRAGIDEPSQVVFVGDWGREDSRHYGMFPAMGGVLIHSDLLVRARGPDGAFGDDRFPGDGPRFYRESLPANCEVALVKEGPDVTVRRCGG